MSEEGFFKRWSRLKAHGGGATVQPPRPAPIAAPTPTVPAMPADAASARPAPTIDDVARLTPDADFSAFVAQGVDKAVQRLALKKLFADPHFKVLDGLDMYMDDYNKPSPVSAAMLAALDHARGALRLPERAAQASEGVGEAAVPLAAADAPDSAGQPVAARAIVTPETGDDEYTDGEDPAATPACPLPPSPQGPA